MQALVTRSTSHACLDPPGRKLLACRVPGLDCGRSSRKPASHQASRARAGVLMRHSLGDREEYSRCDPLSHPPALNARPKLPDWASLGSETSSCATEPLAGQDRQLGNLSWIAEYSMTSILPQQLPLRAARHLTFQTGQSYKASRSSTRVLALFAIGQKSTSGKRDQKKAQVGIFSFRCPC